MGNISDPSWVCGNGGTKGRISGGRSGGVERDYNSRFKSGTCSDRAWMQGIALSMGLSCSNKSLISTMKINKTFQEAAARPRYTLQRAESCVPHPGLWGCCLLGQRCPGTPNLPRVSALKRSARASPRCVICTILFLILIKKHLFLPACSPLGLGEGSLPISRVLIKGMELAVPHRAEQLM